MNDPGQSAALGPSSIRVLLVEDDPGHARLYREYLLGSGNGKHSVIQVRTLAEAEAHLLTGATDIVLLDLFLPDSEGLETVTRILRTPTDPVVVVLTGMSDEGMAIEALESGAEDYLIKDEVSGALLVRSIRYALERRRKRQEREEAQLALRESETRFEHLVEAAHEGICILDAQTRITYANRRLGEMIGKPAGELVGLPAADLLNSRELARALGALEEQQKARELPLRRADGSKIWTVATASPVRDHADRPSGAFMTFADITPLKRAREERERLRRQNDILLDSIPGGVYGLDADGMLTFVNPAAARMLGWCAAELVGKPGHEVIQHSHPDGTPYRRQQSPIYATLERGRTQRRDDEVFWRKDGSSFPVEYTTTPIHDGTQIGAVVTFRDISERRRAEQREREILLERVGREEADRYARELEQVIRELDAQRALLDAILEQMPVGVSVASAPSGKGLYHNPELVRLLGHGMIEGDSYARYGAYHAIHEDGTRFAAEEFPTARAILQGEVIRAEEMRYLRGGETEVIFSVNSAPVLDRTGTPIAAVTTFSDMTEQRKAEERERLFARVLEESRSEIYIFDSKTLRFERVNRGARENLGYSMDELRQLTPLHLKPNLGAEAFEELLTPLRTGERETVHFETVHRRKDGTRYPVDVNLQLSSVGERPLFVALVLDVTARKQAESREWQLIREQAAREAAERTARLQRITAAFSEALTREEVAEVAVTEGITALGAHAGGAAFLGEDSSTLESLRIVGFPAVVEASWRRFPVSATVPMAEVVRSGEVVFVDETRVRERFPDMESALCPEHRSWAAAPLVVEGRIIGSIGMAFGSVTALDQPDREFLQAIANLCAQALERARLFERERRAVQAREELLAVVAHDLRNPLGAINLFSHLLRNSLTGEQEHERLQTIIRMSDQMDRLIQDLLDVTRIEAGKLRVEPGPASPASLVSPIVEMMAPRAAERGLVLKASLPDDLPDVLAERDRIHQVLSNLVGNAIKFTPSGGTIRVTCEARHDSVHFRVRDAGAGLSAEHQEHVFDRFWQAAGGTREGSGLGLAIAKGFVEAHGGRIWMESMPGRGSTFTFSLPLAPQPDAAPRAGDGDLSEESEPQEEVGRVLHTLIVDDHPAIRRGLRAIVERASFVQLIGEAATGEESVEMTRRLRPDVVLMDLEMPGIGGLEAIRRIQDLQLPVRVIALTADAPKNALLAVMRAGAVGFVSKSEAHRALIPALEAASRAEVALPPGGVGLLIQGYRAPDGPRAPSVASGDPFAAFSQQERDTIRMVAEGYSSREIGKKLFLSPHTVDSHRRELMKRLGVSHRSELIKLVVRHGLLTAD